MAGDLETAEARLDDAYTASEKDKNMRYVSTCTVLHSKRVDFEHSVISAVFPSHTCNYIVLFW